MAFNGTSTGIYRTKPRTYGNFVWPIEERKIGLLLKKPVDTASKSSPTAETHYPAWITLLPTTTPGNFSSNKFVTSAEYCELLNCNFAGSFVLHMSQIF